MKKLVSLTVSALILGIIYWTIDLGALTAAFKRTDAALLALAILMVVPITGLTAWRLCRLVPAEAGIGIAQATRLILGASVLNMVLPAKMGDLAKFAFMRRDDGLSGSLSFAIVVFEKTADLLALLVWCAFGLALYEGDAALRLPLAFAVGFGVAGGTVLLASRSAARLFFGDSGTAGPAGIAAKIEKLETSWQTMHGLFWQNPWKAAGLLLFSVFLWFLHLVQIWMFILALNADVPLISALALTPLAILAGLLPLTFAGVGTRDVALIFLFRPFMDAGTGAALGLLCTLRYLLPALGGLPFFAGLLAELKRSQRNGVHRAETKLS